MFFSNNAPVQHSMHYVFVFKDQRGRLNVEYSADLRNEKRRFERNDTRELIYYEAFPDASLAEARVSELNRRSQAWRNLMRRLSE